MTTDKQQVLVQAPPSAPQPVQACRHPGKHGFRRRRRMRRACCCVAFLLVLNMLMLMHISHSIYGISTFIMNGSFDYYDTTYLFVPGGNSAFCNDFCVDMCIYDTNKVNCELESCLTQCHQTLTEEYNGPINADASSSDSNDEDKNEIPPPPVRDYAPNQPIDNINAPLESADDSQQKLDKMQAAIQMAADRIKAWKAKYAQECGDNADSANCVKQRESIMISIETLKASNEEYDTYAMSIHAEVRVSVWMTDLDDVIAEP